MKHSNFQFIYHAVSFQLKIIQTVKYDQKRQILGKKAYMLPQLNTLGPYIKLLF